MEALNDGPLARALEQHRARYNARFALARHTVGAVDPDAFAWQLVRAVDPLVREVHALAPEHTARVIDALYDLSLELVARNLAGPNARVTLSHALWSTLLPRLARFLATDTQRVCASLTNAVFQLSGQPSVAGAVWLSRMAELGPRARDTDELLALGQVLAWRVGMAHWRQSAIERWTLLTPALQRAVFDHAPDNARVTTELLRARLESRWNDPTAPVDTTPRARLEVVARVGDFKGLGGVFLRPPRVFAHDGALFATDGTVHVSLHADPFGATWLTEHDAPAASAVSPPWTLARTAIKRDEASLKLPALAHATSVASVHDTLAFTLPDSHRVTLVGHRTV